MANKTKLSTLVFGITMCLALMLGIVFASPTSTVYAEGGTFEYIEINGDKDVTSTGGTYKYTASDKTLILNNYNGGQFRLNDDATLVLQGNNFITVNENSRFHGVIGDRIQGATGVKADKGLTITGSGTLTINVDITKAEERGKKIMAYGITSSGATGSLTIKDNVKITVNINEGGSEYGDAISAAQDLSIIENASVDITTVSGAVYSNDGKIIFSGTGEKKIRIDRTIEDWDNTTVNTVYASSGNVDISGTGKVLLEAVNGVKIRSIYAASKSIKLHDNANVEINGFERGMYSSISTEIKNSNVKIFSTLVNASAFSSVGNKLLIQDSAVTVDVYSDFVSSYNTSLELQILGKSTVYVQSTNPAMCGNLGENVRKYFALSEGGSITLRALSYDYAKVWAELGEGTNLEVGKKLGQSETNPTWFEYEASQVYSYMTRFVYGDTSKASVTMNDVTIKGLGGEAMPETDVKITLTGDVFNSLPADMDATSWFRNLPKGLTAKVKGAVAAGANEMTITVSGAPTEIYGKIIWLEIPATAFTATNYGMTAEFNRNAKYEIISSTPVPIPTPVSGLVYNGERQEGVPATEAYTVANGWGQSAGTYQARLHLQYGFKWSDDTTEDKIVEWSIARKDVIVKIILNETECEYTGHEITPSFLVRVEEPLVNLSASEYTATLKNNKEVGENTASITVKDKEGGNYNITNTATAYFSIVKPVRNAPEGLKGIAPTTDGGRDGKITGTTADMEYSTDTTFATAHDCENGETAGLVEGTYYVRYKATATAEPSHYATVKVMDNTVTVTDGAGETTTKYKSGDTVTVKVNVPIGKRFVKWSCTGISIPAAELEKEEITFTMPDNDVTLTATFEDSIYNITVTNGTASAPTAKYQEEVTVTANEPAEGKVFKGWQDASGNIVSTEKSYTFTVNGETTLTAVYDDITPAPTPDVPGEVKPTNEGLSGGQIAGIVIGSVAVAGIGGFAVLWFAVKKKTFADLIAAIKKTPKNK